MTTIDHDKLNADAKLVTDISASFRRAKTHDDLHDAGRALNTPAFERLPEQVQEDLIAQYGERSFELLGL